MSHGSSADKCEPNLVPMLDMVLQLVMFFMVCANFVMEQVNETIKLPEAAAAAPLDKNDFVIFLNVNKEGHVLLSDLDAIKGEKVLTNKVQVQNYMKQRFDEDAAAARRDPARPRSVVILRVDLATPFGDADRGVFAVMKACRAAGYERVQLRAIQHGGV